MINQIFQVFDGLKALNVFLLGVATVNLVNGQLLYEENFDTYNDGDAITQVSQAFVLWPAAGATDSFVSNEESWSGANSLKIEGQLTGGPMDVVLRAGLQGIQEFSFRLLVPSGASGYYNFQENIVAGVAWAFECFLNSDGTIRYAVDPAADGSGGPEFTTTYNYGSWIEIKHEFDTDSNLMNTLIDGVCVGELPYDGPEIGGLNFYAQGDGLTLPLYYVDDISVTTLDVLPGCFLGPSGCTDMLACNYDPTAEVSDGSCLFIDQPCNDGLVTTFNDVVNENCQCQGVLLQGCTDLHAVNYNSEANEDDGTCEYWSPGCDECQANFDFGDAPFGFSPDPTLGQSFTEGNLGLPYADAWHILIPSTAAGIDSAFPPQLAIDSVIVMEDMINGAGEYSGVVFMDTTTMEVFHADDLGLSFVLNNGGDSPNHTTMLGGGQYCALLSGMPTREGVYRIAIGTEAWATIAAPFSVPYVYDNFMLTIDTSGGGCTDPTACNYNLNALVDDGFCLYPGDPCDDCNPGTTIDLLSTNCQCVGGDGVTQGCTDTQANNYNPEAGSDDGTCEYDVLGCTDPGAANYDTAANNNDGSCEYDCSLELVQPTGLFFSEYVEGWANNKALEIFNPTSDLIDLSDYQIERYANGATSSAANQRVTLSGFLAPQDVVVCVLDKRDPDGVDFETPVLEALAEKADLWLCPIYDENNAMYFNGNDALVLRKISTNTVIDVFGSVGEDPGTEGWASLTQNHTLVRKAFVTQGDQNAVDNFPVVDEWSSIPWVGDVLTDNLGVVFENLGAHGYCLGTNGTVGGCTDPSAFNFDPTAEVDDGSCTYFETSCAAIGASEWEEFDLGLYAPTALLHMAGQSVTQEVALHLPASIEEEGTGTTYAVADWSGLEVLGMPAGLAFDNMVDLISGGSQTCLTYSGVPTAAGTYEVTLTGELFLSVFGNPVSAGMVEASLVITIEANGNAVFGCTYPHALNFNPLANDDDGSCAFAGCTDPSAENFEPYASVDDGTCATEPCVASCLGDLNNDGTIGSADLLTLLTTFGGDCE